MSEPEGKNEEKLPEPKAYKRYEDDIEKFLDRFAKREARVVIIVTKWFLFAAVAAIGIELLVSVLEYYPALHFVSIILDWLGRFILSCDATVFSVFLTVATLLSVNALLKLIGIDVIWIGLWFLRKWGLVR